MATGHLLSDSQWNLLTSELDTADKYDKEDILQNLFDALEFEESTINEVLQLIKQQFMRVITRSCDVLKKKTLKRVRKHHTFRFRSKKSQKKFKKQVKQQIDILTRALDMIETNEFNWKTSLNM